ncbi:hypothetical protein BGZ65_002235 [Modicella reniformis]|uniref:F-box domain-containing protein n=1 Tax=Modicella reniformis TaxID=1440133 RepID=A0A9P6IPC1_9FUNG|nr:hypothetical protein BGZ65_002235 [Modicella reniformis]
MQETTPFHIPELIQLIADYLFRSEIVNFLRVSKYMHRIFITIVWQDVVVQNSRPFPTGPSLQRHAHLIQRFRCYGALPDEYLALRGCDSLSTFHFEGGERLPADLTAFIAAHSATLRDISINQASWIHWTPSIDFWVALAQCSNLKSLVFYRLVVLDECLSYFRRIFRTVQSLSFQDLIISDMFLGVQQEEDEGTDGMQLVFPGPRRIEISIANSPKHTIAPFLQALMIRACPNLETLKWGPETWSHSGRTPTNRHSSTYAFLRALAGNPWTLVKLESLDLSGVYFDDEDFAQLLGQMRQLISLKVHRTRFGRLSFQELIKKREHGEKGHGSDTMYALCDSVRFLWLGSCPEVTGIMIQTLLASCPKLKEFRGDKVTVSEVAQGQKWVCQSILRLAIYLEADEDDHAPMVSRRKQQAVFGRLGSLTNLRYLELTHGSAQITRTLDLRLSTGLKSLANLKNLESLSFSGDSQQRTGLREVAWMARQWPKLQQIVGFTETDKKIRKKMAVILVPAGISF